MDKAKDNFELVKKEDKSVESMKKIILSKGSALTDKEDFEDVMDIKKKARELRLKIQSLLNPFIATQKEAYDKSRNRANKYFLPLKEIEAQAKTLIVDYEIKIEKEKEITENLKKSAEKEGEKEVINEEIQVKEAPISSSVGIRRAWKVKSVDERLLADEFFIKTVDMVRLNNIARETKGTTKIKGVEFEFC